ncbi:Metallo-dependent phosphatase-like protein [Halteromyces radiatus]|uniref:Metallo-dependent phosphatase-like protein n=1 Tax=Halteromyces radiatus TaxID=101107 RepID=UPI00221F4ADF|nr:Metallo-dependent phosphatase-like protein [Halteromyces radiatus]KAI8096240.1 Metallo-dependent phosphatase-like protein [Halteromyces radiatus]
MFQYLSIIVLCISGLIQANPQQVAFSSLDKVPQHGRFLHLTDIHMDDHYHVGATITSFCHRDPKKHSKKKARKGKLAGYWGAPATDCDSAPHMVYHSIDWIAQEWKDKIDFVIWTGDNARHDTEPGKIRRSGEEILHYNIRITEALQRAFQRQNYTIPIVPCLGNNDVHPHNKLSGPTNDDPQENKQLIIYSHIWRDLIPSDQISTFRHGGYFSVSVAPGIRVLSLNTLYFFDSNDVVGGCDVDGPGRDHIQWMEQQLNDARQQGEKIYIMGHVPPTTKSFKHDCLEAYTRVSLNYQDIIQAHFYGHANMDHFQLLHSSNNDDDGDDDIVIRGNNMARKLRKQYKRSLKKYNPEDLVVIHVAPPLLPVYNPTFRVNEYNADHQSPTFGMWTKYTQWYSDLAYWNHQYNLDNTTRPSFEIEYATDDDYDMQDLSPQSWLHFASLLVKKSPAAQSLWSSYLQNMVVQT